MEESVTECSSITWRQLIKVRQWSSLDQWLITSRSVVKTLLKFSLKDSPGFRWFSIHIGVLQVFWTHRPHCNTFLCFQTCYHFITILSHRHLRLTIIIMLKLIDLCVGGVCVQAHAYMCTDAKECQWHYAYGNPRTIFGSHSTSGPQDWTQVVRRVQQVLLSPGSSCLYWKQEFLIWHVCIFIFLLSKKNWCNTSTHKQTTHLKLDLSSSKEKALVQWPWKVATKIS